MPEVKIVPDAKPDPKVGTKRAVSGVRFPYFDLEKAEAIPRVMHERRGGACDLATLAAELKYSQVSNGAFRTRVSAARMFGLIEGDGDSLRVSGRGRAIVAPVGPDDAARARVEAFLEVELFRKVYEKYHGQQLPPEVGLKNLFRQDFNVVEDRVAPTVRIFYDSAEHAGFFNVSGNRSRMVKPTFATGQPQDAIVTDPQKAPLLTGEPGTPAPPLPPGSGSGSGGGGGGGDGIHPAIAGLLRELPAAGTELSKARRTSLIAAFTAMIDFIYPAAHSDATAP